MKRHVFELLDVNWSFVFGRQNTLRRGDKWGHVNPGDQLLFVCPDNPSKTAAARVTRVTKALMYDLSEEDVLNHHCGYDYAQLLLSMRFAYGDSFQDDELVTLIQFQLL